MPPCLESCWPNRAIIDQQPLPKSWFKISTERCHFGRNVSDFWLTKRKLTLGTKNCLFGVKSIGLSHFGLHLGQKAVVMGFVSDSYEDIFISKEHFEVRRKFWTRFDQFGFQEVLAFQFLSFIFGFEEEEIMTKTKILNLGRSIAVYT